MRPSYFRATKKDMENSPYQQTETRRGCSGTTNTGETQKPDNPFKGIHYPIPRNPDNPLRESGI